MNKREIQKQIKANEKRIRDIERALLVSMVQKVLNEQKPHPFGHFFVWVNGQCVGSTCTDDPNGCEQAIRALPGVTSVWLNLD